MRKISLLENTSLFTFDGGAILFTHPAVAFIRDTNFGSHHAMFGGAFSSISTARIRGARVVSVSEQQYFTRGCLLLQRRGSNIRGSRFYRNVDGENSSRGVPSSGGVVNLCSYR